MELLSHLEKGQNVSWCKINYFKYYICCSKDLVLVTIDLYLNIFNI